MTIINYPRVVDCYTSYCFLISTTNDFIPVRNDMSPSPYPSPTRGEGIKPLLEIKDFGPPARGGHFVRQSHKGRGNKAPSSKSQISVLPQGVDILCFFTPFYPLSHTARSFTRFILHRFN